MWRLFCDALLGSHAMRIHGQILQWHPKMKETRCIQDLNGGMPAIDAGDEVMVMNREGSMTSFHNCVDVQVS
jgi:hypothetical protein